MRPLAVPLDELNTTRAGARLSLLSAREIVEWASNMFGDGLVMSTSFGIQSAVMLHLATQVKPDIPVVWIDTGYLPEETYRFASELTERLDLNLRTCRAEMSPEEMEEVYGRLWESNEVEDLNLYDRIRKVEPLERAMREARATAWLSGLRRDQTSFRRTLSPLSHDGGRYKVLPILRWTSKDVYEYLDTHGLPYHPLFYKGYATVGDWHSSRPLEAGDSHERETRFSGLKEECGIHLPAQAAAPETLVAAAA